MFITSCSVFMLVGMPHIEQDHGDDSVSMCIYVDSKAVMTVYLCRLQGFHNLDTLACFRASPVDV
jgi:hypothetical protein